MARKSTPEKLVAVVSVRLTAVEESLLRRVTASYRLAKRGAVAREALRRGLEAMEKAGRGE